MTLGQLLSLQELLALYAAECARERPTLEGYARKLIAQADKDARKAERKNI